jgi:2-keto-3-deoxygluconate permease
VLIPFFGFALGNTINLNVILDTGLLGIVLGVAVIVITGIPLIIADRVIGEETARRVSPPLQPQGLPSQTR